MLLNEEKNQKNIKIALIIIIFILMIELIFAGFLFINYKKNKNILNHNQDLIENQNRLISEIEKNAISSKENKLEENTTPQNNNPRTRPLPQPDTEPVLLNPSNTDDTNSTEDPRTRPLP